MKFPGYVVLGSLLALATATGCSHPAFTGTLNEINPGGPQPPAGQPSVTSLSPNSVVADGPAFTLTITGQNFAQGDSVLWYGTVGCTVTSTYLSSTQFQAQVPASCLTRAGGVTVDVEPANPEALLFGASLTITVPPLLGNSSFSVSSVPVQANDMVWDPISQKLYLSVAAANGTNGNIITALDPSTAKFGISSPAGGGPDRLTVASDGSYLYAGMDGTASVQRFTLPAMATDISVPLGSYSAGYPYYAMDVEVDPANPHTFAVVSGIAAISPRTQGGVALYDDAVQRPATVPSFSSTAVLPIDSLTWNPAGNKIYGTDGGIVSLSVDPAGLHVGPIYAYPGYGVLHYDTATGYLYADSGQVIDPATGNLIGTFPLSSLRGGFTYSVMVTDDTLHIAYFIGQTLEYAGYDACVIEAYDLTHFTFIGATTITNVVGTPVKLLRWGPDGLAFLTSISLGRPVPGDGVYLVTGGFVTSPANRISPIASDTGALPAGSEH